MKKLILTIALMLISISAAIAQPTLYRNATKKGWVVTGPTRYQLFVGPAGIESPLWLGSEPSGTTSDAWLYIKGNPAGFEYSILSESTKPSSFSGDITVTTESTGGNAYERNQISGLLKLNLVSLGTGVDGTAETVSYMDDTPSGEWSAIDSNVTVSESTSTYRVGSKSLKLAFDSSAANDDGAVIDIVNDNLESNESVGFWIYSDTDLAAGDLDLLIDDTDAAPDVSFDVSAVPANAWKWVEIDISALTGGNGNVVDKVGLVLKNASGLGAFNIWVDAMYKWDADAEEVFGDNIPYDGVLSVLSLTTANTGTHSFSNLVEHTNYFINYQTGNEVLVWITDQSTSSAIGMYVY